MDFDEPHGRPESATIEHLIDSTLGGVRSRSTGGWRMRPATTRATNSGCRPSASSSAG
jgi:hypothetical protein